MRGKWIWAGVAGVVLVAGSVLWVGLGRATALEMLFGLSGEKPQAAVDVQAAKDPGRALRYRPGLAQVKRDVVVEVPFGDGPGQARYWFDSEALGGGGLYVHPGTAAVDAAGNVYINDPTRDVIQVFAAGGKDYREIPVPAEGRPARMSGFADLGTDGTGRLYALFRAPYGEGTAAIMDFAGSLLGAVKGLNEPHDMCVLLGGEFEVLDFADPPDTNLRVQTFDPAGRKLDQRGQHNPDLNLFTYRGPGGERVSFSRVGGFQYQIGFERRKGKELVSYTPALEPGQSYLSLRVLGVDRAGRIYFFRRVGPEGYFVPDVKERRAATHNYVDILDVHGRAVDVVELERDTEVNDWAFGSPVTIDLDGNIYQLIITIRGEWGDPLDTMRVTRYSRS
ncbi:MAG: hypothetical protein M1598_02805 [Actinobacteria bacterium]|nr:hypothetical protein [Actinomycetota bacterium]